MIQFKAEFKYSKILVKTSSLGKIEIDCQKADPELVKDSRTCIYV